MPLIQVRDIQLYYEFHGDGEPLVLLNGALDTFDFDWGSHLPAFTEHYRVLAYDHRGHGRSSSASGPFAGYGQLAEDLAALLDATGIERAHFCGFSDGAITLFEFAPRWPERVRSLILAGGQYTNDERTLSMLQKMTPERIKALQPGWAAELEQLHDTHHEPGYWQELLRQMMPMWRVQPDFSLVQLGQIGAPALLVAGERDGLGHLDQQVAMRRAIPRSELCIAPAAGHFVIGDQPDLFRLVAFNFLRRVDQS